MSVKTAKEHIVLVPKDITAEAVSNFEANLHRILGLSPASIELDCSALQLVSSSHVNLLWTAREKCEAVNVSMKLINVSDRLTRTLKILDLSEFFVTDQPSCHECTGGLSRLTSDVDGQRLQMRLKPVNEEILIALGRFRQYLKDLKINPFCALELESVFYEILTNLREHARSNTGLVVELSAKAGPDAIEMTFIDNGCPFNPIENVPKFEPKKAVRSGQRHGFGLTMITRMTDAMKYERKNNELNVFKVKKYWL